MGDAQQAVAEAEKYIQDVPEGSESSRGGGSQVLDDSQPAPLASEGGMTVEEEDVEPEDDIFKWDGDQQHGVSYARRRQVVEASPFYFAIWATTLPISFTQLAIGLKYGTEEVMRGRRKAPYLEYCDEPHLDKWFVAAGAINIVALAVSWMLWAITKCAVESITIHPPVATPEDLKEMTVEQREWVENHAKKDAQGKKHLHLPLTWSQWANNACTKQMWSVTLYCWLQIMINTFQFIWFLIGNTWIWGSTEKKVETIRSPSGVEESFESITCGNLVKEGIIVFYTQYALYGLYFTLFATYVILYLTGNLPSLAGFSYWKKDYWEAQMEAAQVPGGEGESNFGEGESSAPDNSSVSDMDDDDFGGGVAVQKQNTGLGANRAASFAKKGNAPMGRRQSRRNMA